MRTFIAVHVAAAMFALGATYAFANGQVPEPNYSTCGHAVSYPQGASPAAIAEYEAQRCAATYEAQRDPDPFVNATLQRLQNSAHGGGEGGGED